ncbi:hypothetical protein Cni_G08463 [Canna indica]|uniref:Pentatricopeptide repeat-containing protein n=1 Tax=Canna indica TaxID=4628 RepID=A0AAQ3K0I3_9LILI|nr:hypothetical protein Cni_G08463 [Canna indica]
MAAVARNHLRYHLCLRSFSSAASILNPSDPSAVLTSKQKSRAAHALLKSETDPSRIVDICRAAALSPSSSHVDRVALSTAVSALADSRSFSQVRSLLDSLPSSALPHSIVLYGQAGMLEDAIRAFRECKFPSARSLNSLLFACILAGRHDEVGRIFRDFPAAHGIAPNVDTYNTVVKAFCESGTSRSFYSVLDEMCRAGIKPNMTTFCTALDGFYREERFEDVDKVLGLMKKHDCYPGLSAYNVRIQSLCKLKRSSDAKALFKEMVATGMKPNWVTYNHLVYGFCKEGNLDEAKKLYKEMRGRGCIPNSKFYFTLIYYLCQGEDFEAALAVCKDTMARNWVPCYSTMKMLVKGLVSKSKVEEARDVMEKVKEKFSGNTDMWKEVEEALPQ